jgi:predicted nucleic acid-binding protein
MKNSPVIPLNESLAIAAADVSLKENLAMADVIIVATAKAQNCRIISSDSYLKDQSGVDYMPKN